MSAPVNPFKAALKAKKRQIGLWLGLADAYSAEIVANADFDWVLIDGEHAPNDLRGIMHQLQALAPYRTHAVVRPPIGETWMIKQLLDIGAQSLLVPMVDTAEQAQALVQAVRYPSNGVRGVGSALARAAQWNIPPGYLKSADDQICLMVQIETTKGLANIKEIASVPGVDGVFIGASDLAASMGFLGNAGAPEVKAAVDKAMADIIAAGSVPGALTGDEALINHYLSIGCCFLAVGIDIGLLASASIALSKKYVQKS